MKLTKAASGNAAAWLPDRDELFYTSPRDMASLAGARRPRGVWVEHLMVFNPASGKTTAITSGITNNLQPGCAESSLASRAVAARELSYHPEVQYHPRSPVVFAIFDSETAIINARTKGRCLVSSTKDPKLKNAVSRRGFLGGMGIGTGAVGAGLLEREAQAAPQPPPMSSDPAPSPSHSTSTAKPSTSPSSPASRCSTPCAITWTTPAPRRSATAAPVEPAPSSWPARASTPAASSPSMRKAGTSRPSKVSRSTTPSPPRSSTTTRNSADTAPRASSWPPRASSPNTPTPPWTT